MNTLEFTRPTKEEWQERAATDLKTNDLASLVNWEPFKGVTAGAYYDSSDRVPKEFSSFFSKLTKKPWHLLQEINVEGNVKEANRKALFALNQGATGIIFNSDSDSNKAEDLYNGILPEHCLLAFKGIGADEMGDFFANKYNSCTISGLVVEGKKVRSDNPNFKSLGIAVKAKHDIIPELLSYLEKLETYRHIYGDDFLKFLNISVKLNQKFYQSIALLRSLRWLTFIYSQSENLSFNAEQLHINVTIDISGDYKIDLLTNTSSGVAAVIGGADSISFTLISDKGSDFNERIARNIGNLMRDESGLDMSSDPINGSYFIDFLTNAISELSWNQYINQS